MHSARASILRQKRPQSRAKNHEIWVHSEQTKHVAERLAQSSLKNVAIGVFNSGRLLQKVVFEQIGQVSGVPFTSTT